MANGLEMQFLIKAAYILFVLLVPLSGYAQTETVYFGRDQSKDTACWRAESTANDSIQRGYCFKPCECELQPSAFYKVFWRCRTISRDDGVCKSGDLKAVLHEDFRASPGTRHEVVRPAPRTPLSTPVQAIPSVVERILFPQDGRKFALRITNNGTTRNKRISKYFVMINSTRASDYINMER